MEKGKRKEDTFSIFDLSNFELKNIDEILKKISLRL